ncbi:MAG TPA: NmrA family transcriptional regulator [Acidimicrobiia bacterium]|nr:NmrA family transcriptional regulator [Acidimicrobiia bacterium]
MRIVVVGGTGLVGSKVVETLIDHGHDAVPASPASGVDTLTGEGLAGAIENADVVVDVTNSPSFEDAAVMEFFETSTRNLLAEEESAGVKHHVVLSVVGTDRLAESGYFRAKAVQEHLSEASSVAHSIVHATQFFEFVRRIADAGTDGDTVRLPPVLVQPMAVDDVAAAVAGVAAGAPLLGVTEVAGPEQFRLDELVGRALAAAHDPRRVVADPEARYFGARLAEDTLLPGAGAALGGTRLADWVSRKAGTAIVPSGG